MEIYHDFSSEVSIHFRTKVKTWDKCFNGEIVVFQDDFKSNFDRIFDTMKETIRKEILKSDIKKG